ncbi:hypothetical protein K7432_014101 [Basidiobolus ranarum]|uniref:N-acetyltransferase domain-containing protein n=1 Tax=Basidiobolus ranarum TaxID=34480 RepID=A0ABR2WI43_9FUNG
MTVEKLVIKPVTLEESKLIHEWGESEGWNSGVHDWKTIFHANSDGFLVGHLGNKPICCIAIFRYEYQVAFIGWYYVLTEYRGKGYGLTMFNHAMKLLKSYNIGLNAVPAQEGNYAKIGFLKSYDNVLYEGEIAEDLHHTHNLKHMQFRSLNQIGADKASRFEYEHTGILRLKWWKAWLDQPDLHSLALITDDQTILAIASSRLNNDNSYSISHLYATDIIYAEAILTEILLMMKATEGSSHDINFDIMLISKNLNTKVFIETFNLQFSESSTRMWTGGPPTNTEVNNIYAAGSSESG